MAFKEPSEELDAYLSIYKTSKRPYASSGMVALLKLGYHAFLKVLIDIEAHEIALRKVNTYTEGCAEVTLGRLQRKPFRALPEGKYRFIRNEKIGGELFCIFGRYEDVEDPLTTVEEKDAKTL